jgi:Xaa-Pro aminopeptidase
MRHRLLIVLAALLAPAWLQGQHYQTDFPPEEFKARWAGVFERIGEYAVAVVQGAPMTRGFNYPRQSNSFYYLSGVETPGAYIVLDGRTKRAVLFHRYYTSDIGRVWPVNGTYAPWQRELVQFILEYRNAILARIRPGVSSQQIMKEAAGAMEAVFARTTFSKPAYEKAARTLVERGGGVFSHTVGMAVHDVGSYRGELKPGHVFSVDPQLRVPEENLYLRYEDTVVVTDNGVENFTDFLPSALDDIERLVQEKGVVQKVPPIPESAVLRGKK